MKDVKETIDVQGPITEVGLAEFGWQMFVRGWVWMEARDGLLLNYAYDLDEWSDVSDSDISFRRLRTFTDIVYSKIKPGDRKKRYVEYHIKSHTAKMVDDIQDNPGERDQCFYIAILNTPTYQSNIIYEAIKKKMREKK
jgi:hypothetical protein